MKDLDGTKNRVSIVKRLSHAHKHNIANALIQIQPILDLLAGQISNARNVPRTAPGSLVPLEVLGESAG